MAQHRRHGHPLAASWSANPTTTIRSGLRAPDEMTRVQTRATASRITTVTKIPLMRSKSIPPRENEAPLFNRNARIGEIQTPSARSARSVQPAI